jgi:hypothetical protein
MKRKELNEVGLSRLLASIPTDEREAAMRILAREEAGSASDCLNSGKMIREERSQETSPRPMDCNVI